MPEASRPLRIGVLSVQGGFEAHAEMLRNLGADATAVRVEADLGGLDGLVIPGGESTTIAMGIESAGLAAPLRSHLDAGKPVFGTCAGMILCDSGHLGMIDITTRRNAYGRQAQSFEADLVVDGTGSDPFHAVFIRAPLVEDVGPGVEVLASHQDNPVVVRDDLVLVCSFHPELTDDPRIHALFMAMVTSAAGDRGGEVQEEETTA